MDDDLIGKLEFMELNLYTCYVCGKSDGLLASVRAPGTYFMCDECILKKEIATGKVAVFGPHGIEFVSPSEAERLTGGEETEKL